jgi:hypothetical protein
MLMTAPRSCQDCGANPGESHGDGCDTALCLHTGRQRLSCDVGTAVFGWPETHPHDDCGSQVWSGAWPGEAECEVFGWHSYFVPHKGWLRCGPDYPEAGPDLNRLVTEAEWNREARRWRRRGEPVDDTAFVHWHLDRGLSLEPSARYTVDGVTLPAAELLARVTGRTP